MDLSEWYRQAVLNRIALKAALRDLDRLESMLREHTHGVRAKKAVQSTKDNPAEKEAGLGEGGGLGEHDSD